MGGGGSRCSKQDHVEPKKSVDLNVGLSIATSEQCASCSLSFPLGNTASAAGMTRDGNMVVIRPFSPFVAVFNGRQFTFTELRVYHPAPMRIEGVQADAVIQCNSGKDLEIFIPLKKGSTTGASGSFLSAMGQRLDPSTSGGLGITKKDSKEYEQFDIVTGQDWSLTNLVADADPYFTWVDSKLEQYVKADLMCDRYIGWRSLPGPQVIYFQNPVTVASADIDKLTATVGAVMPTDALSVVTHPLYSAGKANCPPRPPKITPPSSSSVNVAAFGNIFIYFISVLLVLLAVAIVSFGIQTMTGRSIVRDISETASSSVASAIPSGPPRPESSVVGMVTAVANPAAAAQAAAALATKTASNRATAHIGEATNTIDRYRM